MALTFPEPDPPRVLFKNNPLVEVICQFRFETCLAASTSEGAVAFHEKIAHSFPGQGWRPGQNAPPSFVFTTRGGEGTVALDSGSMALIDTAYERWERFEQRLSVVLRALQEVFPVETFTRVGLRYRDFIDQAKLGLDEPWSRLLREPIYGVFSDPRLAAQVQGMRQELVLQLVEGGHVRVRHGTGIYQQPGQGAREGYLIDSDFFLETQGTRREDALSWLDDAHRDSGRLFRWCITDALHEALEPQNLPTVRG